MDETVILALIGILTLVIILTIVILFVYFGGLLSEVTVEVGKPPVVDITVFYKYGNGSYADILGCGYVFTEAATIAHKHKCFGVYYDNPEKVVAEKLRWAVGVIMKDKKDDQEEKEVIDRLIKKEFKEFHFPRVDNVVKSSYPFRSQLSIIIGVKRVYPRLAQYVKEKRLCAHPWLEVYDDNTVHYFAPLSKQESFYVPEALAKGQGSNSKSSKQEKHSSGSSDQIPTSVKEEPSHTIESHCSADEKNTEEKHLLQIEPLDDTKKKNAMDEHAFVNFQSNVDGLRERKTAKEKNKQDSASVEQEIRSKSVSVLLCDIQNKPVCDVAPPRSASAHATPCHKHPGDSGITIASSNSTPVGDFSGLQVLNISSASLESSLIDESSASSFDSVAGNTTASSYDSSEYSYAGSTTSQNTTCNNDELSCDSDVEESKVDDGKLDQVTKYVSLQAEK